MNPGSTVAPFRSVDGVPAGASFWISSVVPMPTIVLPATAMAWAVVPFESMVTTLPLT